MMIWERLSSSIIQKHHIPINGDPLQIKKQHLIRHCWLIQMMTKPVWCMEVKSYGTSNLLKQKPRSPISLLKTEPMDLEFQDHLDLLILLKSKKFLAKSDFIPKQISQDQSRWSN